MRISVDEARPYLSHLSQLRGSKLSRPEDLPLAGVEYWAVGPVLGMFHLAPWPGVWMGHFAVLPDSWGRTVVPAKAVLREFWEYANPARIVGWTEKSNRAALAFTRRLGFTVDGEMPLPTGNIIMQGWVG